MFKSEQGKSEKGKSHLELVGCSIAFCWQDLFSSACIPVLCKTWLYSTTACAMSMSPQPKSACLAANPDACAADLVFIQNGMLQPWLAERGLENNTQVIQAFADPAQDACVWRICRHAPQTSTIHDMLHNGKCLGIASGLSS